ncbi:hypothetical protein DOTSEDRAFT_52475 [Dothistroma septosporum NZE10]|uniref:Uncharacterized protein n=1 Tax=Dothistroma septosporum (strain NZE10 / CBS 128990) TaxID=675120 RepID=N1PRX0_DOTSN|nr:hypothetical protein DOTSEDRAFT_52475 [Dothistroma septosporum NZE10]
MAGPDAAPSSSSRKSDKMNGRIHGEPDTLRSRSSRTKRKAPKRTYTGWITSQLLRAGVWYTILTFALRCPQSTVDLEDTSPRICKPYLQFRDYVTPYTQPYYDQYAAPYVEKVQPYIDQANDKVYKPASAVYTQYGAPRVAQAQQIGQQQWAKSVKPQLDGLQKQAGKQYQKVLAPHVQKAQDTIKPYYEPIVSSASDIWEIELEPVYRKTRPLAEKLYQQGSSFAVQTALPQARFVGNTVWSFWSRQIWPRLAILYGENVEPQLLRITERLGRYKDGKKLEAEIDSIETSSKLSKASVHAASSASSLSSTLQEATASPSSAASAAASSASSSVVDATPDPKAQFQEDLKSWETISGTAVQEGADDLKERIKEITARQISSGHRLGEALIVQLEQTAEAAINSVKATTQQLVGRVPEDATSEQVEEAKEDLVQGLRAAGQNVKQRAQAVREWRQSHQAETQSLVEQALQSTLETIDSIREIRLSEIGRKYASSSLPHKEWAKYNDLKKATQAWRNDVEKDAHAHAGIVAAKATSEDIEQRAMAIAEDAAKELVRLKEVGKWKIDAADDTDDFSTKYVPAPVRKVKDQVVEKAAQASQAVMGEKPEQGNIESATSVIAEQASKLSSSASEQVIGSSTGSIESASSKAASKASSLSEKVVGSSTGSVESAASKAAEKASSVTDSVAASLSSAISVASENVVGAEQPTVVVQYASSLSDKVVGSSADSIESAASKASEKILGTESGLSDSATDAASSLSSRIADKPNTKNAASKLSSALSAQKANAVSAANELSSSGSSVIESATGAPPVASHASSSAFSLASAASSSISSASSSVASAVPGSEEIAVAAESIASQATEKVWGGAMAQVIVEAREPILDDDDVVDTGDSFSSSIQSIVSVAGDKANVLTQIVQDAINSGLAAATSTQGTAASVPSLASEQWQSAMAVASSAIYGTHSNAVQSVSSLAKEQYQSAVTAAQYAIYGTPVTVAPLAAASSAYQSALRQASSQYDNAVVSASSLWLDGQNAAKSGSAEMERQYSSAITAASYAIYGTPVAAAPLTHASSAYDSATKEALRHYAAVKSRLSEQVSSTPEPVHQQMFSSAESAYSAAVAAASSKLHDAGIATTQNAYDSIYSVASARLAEGVSAASAQYASARSLVGAEPTPVHQQYLASAQKAYYEALGVAHGRYSEFVEAASSVVAPTPTATGISARIESALSGANVGYSSAVAEARSRYSTLTDLAAAAAEKQGSRSVDPSMMDNLNGQLADGISIAQSKLARASSDISAAVLGEEPTGVESIASQASQTAESLASRASENWDALIAKASQQVYGAPLPFTESVASRATEVAAQATAAAAAQWSAVQDVFNELVSGKEPDFTASIYGRLQSAYSTAAPALASQASSYVGEAYSAISAAFVPPTQVPGILEQMQAQLNQAVAAASTQVYGTTKGSIEQATEAAASMYSDVASQASEAVYGEESSYVQAAQASFTEIGASASSAIYAAIYGTGPTGTAASVGSSASSAAASVYSSVASKGEQQASAASAAVSKAIYGEQQSYLDGVQSQLSAAISSANSRLSEFGTHASSYAGDAAAQVSSAVGDAASSASSIASEAAKTASSAASKVTQSHDEL